VQAEVAEPEPIHRVLREPRKPVDHRGRDEDRTVELVDQFPDLQATMTRLDYIPGPLRLTAQWNDDPEAVLSRHRVHGRDSDDARPSTHVLDQADFTASLVDDAVVDNPWIDDPVDPTGSETPVLAPPGRGSHCGCCEYTNQCQISAHHSLRWLLNDLELTLRRADQPAEG
jgi:hypothetical protein